MSVAAPQTSAPSPAVPLYRERLTPSVPVWIVAAVTGAIFGVILVPISVVAAVVVAIAMAIAVCVALAVTSPLVEVTGEHVAVGRARIEPELLGAPETLDADGWAETMSTGFEPLAYHCTRGWLREGVRVPVLDDDDPTTAWVISSRRPEQLALAVLAARERA